MRYSQATGKESSGMNRRIWPKEEKTAIVLEMVNGGESMAATHIPWDLLVHLAPWCDSP